MSCGASFNLASALAASKVAEWQTPAGYRALELLVPKSGKIGFTQLHGDTTGITFTNLLSDSLAESNRILENGSGIAAGDIDGDGWCDLYFCRIEGSNALYRNLGNWRFREITATAGVACSDQFSTGAVFADVDGNGDLDLLINGLGRGTRLFLNDGRGHFTESPTSGLLGRTGSTSMALADIDGDGDLDLYVTNYRTTTILDSPPDAKYDIQLVGGHMVVQPAERFAITGKGPQLGLTEKGEADVLYLNDGKGHFTPLSWTDGTFRDEGGKPLTAPPQGWGLSVMFHDLNGDGAPDIYVCNDFFYTGDDVWLNDSHGHFQALPKLCLRNSSWSSMAADFADINRDGRDDFMVVDMLSRDHARRHTQRANPDFRPPPHPIGVIDDRPQVMRNTLFLNRSDGTYAEIAQLSGVEASEWSWGIVFLDVDLDGFEDVLVTTGNLHDVLDADAATRNQAINAATKSGPRPKTLLNFPRLETPSLAFRNRGDLTFEEVGRQWGFDAIGISHGMALADLDNDGDLDVIVNNLRAEAGIFRNDTIAPRVAVRLKGEAPNTQGIGARIRVTGGPVAQSQEIISGGRYLSGDDPMRVFATGTFTNELTIEVTWRSGKASRVSAVMPNRLYEIAEAGGASERESVKREASATRSDALTLPRSDAPTPPRSHVRPIFEDVSDLLNHSHHEDPFIRFGPQPQLPNRLTELGPGVAWFDIDGDGWDDLIIGCGKGGTLAVHRNNGQGGFEAMQAKALATVAKDDFTGLVGWVPSAGKHSVLIGLSNYESARGESSSVLRYDYVGASLLGPARFRPPQPGIDSPQSGTVGALALADIDGDGDLDLFVGGRVIPGRYPEPASSRIFRNVGGRLELDGANSDRLTAIGLVSGAVFSDLDGDGDADLALACEWGPIRVFRNDSGQFTEATADLGLDQYRGWWNGITTGDFDVDGRLDIVASNWGRNTKYQRYRAQPLRIYYGDFREDGDVETIEAHFDPGLGKIVPWLDFASATQTFPWLRETLGNYRAYSVASVEQILGHHFAKAKELEATCLESTVFLNRGAKFEARVLPLEAQFAPAFGVAVADFDGDGNEDVFLAQNFFATQPETSRYDAGRGLWLRGDGHGSLTAVPGQESGVLVYGEQRGAALSDYDADGRVDLVVTQNGATTKLYRNAGARPGLRIRLTGPPANPSAVGAAIRLRFGGRWGPAREIHAGSGYWSQDSPIVVMACPEPPTAIWVRWPGGKIIEVPIPQPARELSLDATGKVTSLR